jgi:hypothetical protein
MRGRQPGRPTKWVHARVEQWLDIDRTGLHFVVFEKWKQKRKRLGTLVVSVGGLRWRPANGKYHRRRDCGAVSEWLTSR